MVIHRIFGCFLAVFYISIFTGVLPWFSGFQSAKGDTLLMNVCCVGLSDDLASNFACTNCLLAKLELRKIRHADFIQLLH